MEDRPKIETLVRFGECAYSFRDVYATFTYSDGVLIARECPRNGCTRSRFCKLYNLDPLHEEGREQ